MCDDKDIKIAGNYPSREIKKSVQRTERESTH